MRSVKVIDEVIHSLQAASSHWWNFRHFQHHAKPNVIRKDPDIDVAYLFLLGDNIPKSWAEKKRGFMPYNFQQSYWFMSKFYIIFGWAVLHSIPPVISQSCQLKFKYNV